MRMREFLGADFDPVARMLGQQWHAHHGEHSFWQGADELCDHLSQTDHGLVCEDGSGGVAGVMLLRSAREQDRNDMMRMHWLQQRTRLAAMAGALGVDARADVSYLNDEAALMERAAREVGEKNVGEVVLLFVAEASRGRGVGRALWERGTAWLGSHGAGQVRLVTDDGCDWGFYERLGLCRVLEATATADPSCGMYVYQADL